jgi:phage tail-like protein
MPETARHDPFLNFNFFVEIDGNTVGSLTEADLPEGTIEITDYREGSERPYSGRRLPGRVTFSHLILRRGFTTDRTFFDWWRAVANGDLDRRDVAVILLNQTGQEVARWSFPDALPAKYSGPAFRARGNEVAIESLDLAVEGMELAS